MVPEWARKIFSGQADEALAKLAEREEARREVENTRWYRIVNERLEQELEWAEKELRNASIFHFQRLQAYATSIELVLGFIRGTEKGGQAASELLSERIAKRKPKSVDEFMDEIMGVHE
jgi:hypothetical protein